MKKFFTMLLCGLLFTGMLTGCGEEEAAESGASESGDSTADTVEKAEIYILIKNRGDLSYWDSMAEGGDIAIEEYADEANIYVVETTDDLQANLTAMYEAADDGADLIISASDFKDNIITVAGEYPEIGFVLIGEPDVGDNIYAVDYATSEAAFLAGIAAADAAQTEGSDTVGFIGGMDESLTIQEFLFGYMQGARYYNPDAKIAYNYVGAWDDPVTARTQALTQYNDSGAAVIFACAGGSGNGVHTAAEEADKFVIGVDSDQSLMYEEDKDIQEKFLTSVLKESGNTVRKVIGDYLAERTLPYGEYEIMGLNEEAVNIVEGDQLYGNISEAAKTAMEEARAGISSGEIEFESAIGKDQDEIKAMIDEYTK